MSLKELKLQALNTLAVIKLNPDSYNDKLQKEKELYDSYGLKDLQYIQTKVLLSGSNYNFNDEKIIVNTDLRSIQTRRELQNMKARMIARKIKESK